MIRERTEKDQTGSSWILGAAQTLANSASVDSRDRRIVGALLTRQKTGAPVHEWSALTEDEMEGSPQLYQSVADIMSTDLFTVAPEDPITLAASTMTWKHIKHLPVEDASGNFVGLVSSREILAAIAERGVGSMTVREVMNAEPRTIGSEMSTIEAVRLMLEEKLDCLPVLKDRELIGIVSTQDMMLVLACLLNTGQQPAEQANAAAV